VTVGGGEGVVRCAHHIGAQLLTPAVQPHDVRLYLRQVPHQVGP
jgi:hypothetical protein